MYVRISISAVLFCLVPLSLKSQGVEIHSGFQADSIRIGDHSAFFVSVHYPDQFRLVLPDSTFDYGEFELVRREWFPTRKDNSVAFDSVIYYFTTFEIDTFINITLPVYILQGSDCLVYHTSPDSLILKEMIPIISDTLKLKSDTKMLRVSKAFNYPLVLLVTGILVILAGLTIAFFGKNIARQFRIYRMGRRHRIFTRKFYSKLGRLQANNQDMDLEHVLFDWKKYMENLEKEPYTKLTTRELAKIYADHELADNLKGIDRFIYGNIKDKPLHLYFSNLLEYSIKRFHIRIKEVQDGL